MTNGNVHFGHQPRVVLVGPPGSGKTTIGRRLSRALNCDLVDSDAMIEQAKGKPCGEVYSELGEVAFREFEATIVAKALESNGVVSLGGGAVLAESTRHLLEAMTVIHLDVTAEEGVRRTGEDDSRPVLASGNPIARYQELLDQRRECYRSVADFKVRTDGRTPQQSVGDILGFLEAAEGLQS
ncbi:shikimate kinase [Corynebacterium phocae]|uniref:Shikimate kinase n=1 Tax=Corynebacterium phocae TaxID=161895 RepID=A0A1L7D2Q2_9CORY|nr:shikimate kinase [Corynebacterium phocae]APT92446.1 shikimate kinase [Corynebacterium phocae]KAA8725047.1 shikimate kinase [Corynebacterium phocae]